MRQDQRELDWRVMLGDEAKALVLTVIEPNQRPTSKDLEAAIQLLKRENAVAQGQAEGAKAVASELAARLEGAMGQMRGDLQLAMMALTKVHREMYLMRQALALTALSTKPETDAALEKLREKTAEISAVIERIMPEYERRLPDYDAIAEERALREMMQREAETRPKDKPKSQEKGDQERER